jgi:hypothetical protein
MPLLLKFNKAKIKSFQAGGSTQFYATAGFNASPTKFAIYNPGKLLEAYKPDLSESPETKVKKEVTKPAEFKFDGKGHKLDNEIGNQVISKALQKIRDARSLNMSEQVVAEAEQDAAMLLANISNQKEQSLKQTELTQANVITENLAGTNYVFNNGKYFGTNYFIDKDGQGRAVDKEMDAFEFADLLIKNEKLEKEGKKPESVFVPMDYNSLFEKRNSKYTSINGGNAVTDGKSGDEIISTIAANGMGVEKAKKFLNESFDRLGENQQAELKATSSSIQGVASTSSSTEKYGNNLAQLQRLEDQWGIALEPRVKNALKRQAWNNVIGSKISTLSEDKSKRDEQLDELVAIEYTKILKSVLDPKIKVEYSNAALNKEIVKNALGSGADVDKFNIGKYLLDVYNADKKTQSLSEFIPSEQLDQIAITANKPSTKLTLTAATGKALSKEEQEKINEEEKLKVNKNIAINIKMKEAPNASKYLNDRSAEIADPKYKTDEDKRYLRVGDLSLSGSPISSIKNARTLNNIELGNNISDMVILPEKGMQIAWMPVYRKNDTVGTRPVGEDEFALNPGPEEEIKLKEFISSYEKERANLDILVAAKQIEPKELGEKVSQLNDLYKAQFEKYKIEPYYVVTVGYNEEEVPGNQDLKDNLYKVSTKMIDGSETSAISKEFAKYAEIKDEVWRTDNYRTMQVFIPLPGGSELQIASGEKVSNKDNQIIEQQAKNLKDKTIVGPNSQVGR